MKNVKIVHWSQLFVLVQTCLAQADFAPYFYDNGPHSSSGNLALFSLSEDTPVGTQIYSLNGSDPEGQDVTYGLSFEPGSREYFSVDPKSGNITLAEELDREKQDSIDVLVSITDGRSKVVEKVTIFVTDANDERPEFQNMPAIIDVVETTEPGRSIYRVEAVDRDTGSGGSITFFLQNAQAGLFAIDRHSGIIRIKSGETLDYEKSRTHFITVVAKDGGGTFNGRQQFMSSSATLTINVIDAQDTPPSFIGTPYFAFVYEVSSPGSEIFTVVARDGDENDPHGIIYSIEDGDDGVFGINRSSGCITLLTDPSLLKREIYNIRVKAAEVRPDGRLLDYSLAQVAVKVVDLNNNPPTFYGEHGPQNVFEMTMHEHPPEGEILRGLKITVNDSDQGANAKFNLRLIGPGRMLRVVPQTVLNEAQVAILVDDSAAMDYEKNRFFTYKLLAVEIDTPERFSATADIIIHLLDTNDNAPKFSSDYYVAKIPENSPGGSNIVTVTATDPDSGSWGEVNYSIYGSGAELFLIDSTSGIIYTQPWANLDAELRSKYNFYVKAEDAEGKYSFAEVFVTVLDMNDHSPAFSPDFVETTMVIGAPVTVKAVDEDAEEPNNVIEYTIMTAEPDNIFDIDSDTGEIMLKSYVKSMAIVQNITRKKDCTWSLVVQARDMGQPSFSTTAVVKLDITEATRLKGGPLELMQNRNKHVRVLSVLGSVVLTMIVVTVFISTIMFVRNKKSNRILPNRRVKRRQKQQPWTFRNPFKKPPNSGERFQVAEEELEPQVVVVDNVNSNNNIRPPPPPPCAPALPPAPPLWVPVERRAGVPTVSATIATRPKRKPLLGRRDTVNKALVSELKLRLEQKRMMNHC